VADPKVGKTAKGQLLYDLGLSGMSARSLARKHGLPIAEVRRLRAKVLEALKPRRQRKRRIG
jgi:hypothetical protein